MIGGRNRLYNWIGVLFLSSLRPFISTTLRVYIQNGDAFVIEISSNGRTLSQSAFPAAAFLFTAIVNMFTLELV